MNKKILLLAVAFSFALTGCETINQSIKNLNCSFDTTDESCTIEQIKEKYQNNPEKLKMALDKRAQRDKPLEPVAKPSRKAPKASNTVKKAPKASNTAKKTTTPSTPTAKQETPSSTPTEVPSTTATPAPAPEQPKEAPKPQKISLDDI